MQFITLLIRRLSNKTDYIRKSGIQISLKYYFTSIFNRIFEFEYKKRFKIYIYMNYHFIPEFKIGYWKPEIIPEYSHSFVNFRELKRSTETTILMIDPIVHTYRLNFFYFLKISTTSEMLILEY